MTSAAEMLANKSKARTAEIFKQGEAFDQEVDEDGMDA